MVLFKIKYLTHGVNKTVNKSIAQNKITLLSFLNNYMEKVKTQPSSYIGKHLSQSRIVNLQLTVNILNTFSKERYQIDFSDITMNLTDQFKEDQYNKLVDLVRSNTDMDYLYKILK